PSQLDAVARALARNPSADNFPYLVRGLQSGNKVVVLDVIDALKKTPSKPKIDEPAPFRSILLASEKLDTKARWKAVELLRYWGNRNFGAEQGQWKEELTAWTKWYSQSFPKEAPLPNLVADKPPESKYKFDDLLAYLEKDPTGSK